MFVEEPPVHLFDREVESPEITVVLSGPGFLRFVDDPEMHPVSVRCLDSGEVEQLEADRLKHPVLAPVKVVSLLDARGEIQFVPAGVVFAAVVVARLKSVPPIEVKLPHVFAHRIAPHTTSCPVADVVVHLAVVNQRTLPLVIIATVLLVPRRGFHIVFLGDQMVNRHLRQCLGRVLHDLVASARSAGPVGHAVVAKVSKVGRGVVGVGRGDRLAKRGPN